MGSKFSGIEKGSVNWSRSVNKSLLQSKQQNKPVFLLFNEIPGCSTCTRFGSEVLSNPTLVDAIEKYFIPCVINNRGLTPWDSDALKRFNEPYLNNPVVRFINSEGKDIIPRRDGIYSARGILSRMVECLAKFGNQIPEHLLDEKCLYSAPPKEQSIESKQQLIIKTDEKGKNKSESIVFIMFCYWEGEGCLNYCLVNEVGLEGAISTRSIWTGGAEGVILEYYPDLLDINKLIKVASSLTKFSAIRVETDEQQKIASQYNRVTRINMKSDVRDASDGDQKYYFLHTTYKNQKNKLSEKQKIFINGNTWGANRLKKRLPFSDKDIQAIV